MLSHQKYEFLQTHHPLLGWFVCSMHFKLVARPSLIDDVTQQVKIALWLWLLMKTSAVCRSNDITGEYGGDVTVDRPLQKYLERT